MLYLVTQADHLESFLGLDSAIGRVHPHGLEGYLHVGKDRFVQHEVEGLEEEPYFVGADLRKLLLVHLGQVQALQEHLP